MLEKGSAQEILSVIRRTQADMLIAGGRNQYTALKARIPFLDINQERHHPYAGYVGMIEMAKELDEALHSPVWQQLRLAAPWETSGTVSESSRNHFGHSSTVSNANSNATSNPSHVTSNASNDRSAPTQVLSRNKAVAIIS